MDKVAEMYLEEVTPANEIKGFTKSFQKRSRDKKVEDKNITDLLSYLKEGKIICGSKVTEKAFKRGYASKVYAASNCDDLTYKKICHYANIVGVEVIKLNLDNDELSQKLGKPFLVSMVCVRI